MWFLKTCLPSSLTVALGMLLAHFNSPRGLLNEILVVLNNEHRKKRFMVYGSKRILIFLIVVVLRMSSLDLMVSQFLIFYVFIGLSTRFYCFLGVLIYFFLLIHPNSLHLCDSFTSQFTSFFLLVLISLSFLFTHPSFPSTHHKHHH